MMNQTEKNALARQAEACLASGQLEQAKSLYSRLVEIDGKDEEAWLMLAAVMGETGSIDEALRCAQQAIAVDPQYLEAYLTQAHLFHRCGRNDEALQSAQQAAEGDPSYTDAWLFLAGVAGQLQRWEDAHAWATRALSLEPENAEAHVNLGNALYHQQRFEEAAASYRSALTLQPGSIPAMLGLGNALLAQGEFSDAAAILEQAMQTEPDRSDIKSSLGICYASQNRPAEAIAILSEVVAEQPDNLPAQLSLGRALSLNGDPDAAIDCLNSAVQLAQDSVQARVYLGHALKRANRLTEAAVAYEEAQSLAPNNGELHYFAAGVYLEQGRVDESINALRQALQLEPDLMLARSALVYALNYPSDINPESKLEEALTWYDMYAASVHAHCAHSNSPDPDRRLRIGYLSPDFRDHSVAFFLAPLLDQHHSDNMEIYCYSNVEQPDARTMQLQNAAHHWRDINRHTDAQVADQIVADQIDILVDLAGHTLGGRLGVFALKPAPVQVSYLGYPATTGVAAIDYRFTDNIADPQGMTDQYHVETLVRLPHGFLCYTPPDDAPSVATSPATDKGYVTFGSFNHICKISANTLSVWAAIMGRVPDSRLVLKYKALNDTTTRSRILERFQEHDIAADRIDLLDFVPSRQAHLDTYGQVDIALDTFPYNGTTTTCEALWMGVPVVTLAGREHAGRVGASLLRQVGLESYIADTEQDYIDIAATAASNPQRNTELRHSLRSMVATSELCDQDGFADSIGETYRTLWKKWCENPERS
jgi:predicted O-linked N-acetylglucosamine transferase (SPINDLY family)